MLETFSDDKFFGNFEGVLTETDINMYAAMRGQRKFKYGPNACFGCPFRLLNAQSPGIYYWGAQFAPRGVVG